MRTAHKIAPGVKGEAKWLVTADMAIGFLGAEGARVLSTPHMIGCMERTCRDTALPLLEPGHDTVGTKVNVSHLAAAPIGSSVSFTAEIVAATDHRLEFRVEAWDEHEKIGEGTHERAIIDVAKFTARLARKKNR
jgi:predicted thioesterase